MERMRIEREKEEAAIADTMLTTKKKLLNDLAEDEAKREADVKKLQQLRDEEKKTLFTSLSSGKNIKYSGVHKRSDAYSNLLSKPQLLSMT